MALLPMQILPETLPIGTVQPDGKVQIDHNWWLLWYNLCAQVLGGTQGLPASALTELASSDSDAMDTDAVVLRRAIANLDVSGEILPDNDLPAINRALLLAQDGLLQDPPPRAQPIASVSPTGSPYTYTAPFAGTVSVTSGTVSQITVIRTGVSVVTGLTSGLFQLSRFDQLQVTYTGTPTMNFIPWSPQ